MVLQNCGTNIKLVSSYICMVLEFHQMLVLMCNVNLQGYDMGASKTAVGFIFSVYPLVGFFLAPVVGILVSNHLMACIHIHSISKCVVLTLILVCMSDIDTHFRSIVLLGDVKGIFWGCEKRTKGFFGYVKKK